MIVGTAGHIDHGKSTLVRALTGIDPDRLAEEKARGITIDLGYAYTDIEGTRIGFVDVPGHERLVRNMLAGASGIDHVLAVVAADDGVMPQTREHLAILDLLGLTAGAVVITKVDRVSPDRIDQVTDEVRTLAAGTTLAQAPVFPIAAPTGVGLDALRAHLAKVARIESPRALDGLFRLAIDRVFTLPGAGLVVTGTVHSGVVTVGDELVVVDGAGTAHRVRVRGIHALNATADRAAAGERASLNLAGQIEREQITRGDWVLDARAAAPTDRLDVRLRVLDSEAKPLAHWTPIHCHLGAADRVGHVAILNADEAIAPGASSYAQIVLERPLCATHGDRLVLRDQSATRTIAGGCVLDIAPPTRRRRAPERIAMLDALAIADREARLGAALAQSATGLSARRLVPGWNLASDRLGALATAIGAQAVALRNDTLYVGATAWTTLGAKLTAALDAFHRAQPDEAGIERDRLRRMALPALDREVYARLVDDGIAAGSIASAGAWLHRPSHRIQLSRQEEQFRDKVVPRIEADAFDPLWMRDLAKLHNLDERTARTYLKRLARAGSLHQVVPDLFYGPRAMDKLIATARELAARDGTLTAAAFRDALGIGRKRAIQILEYFDRIGLTRRVGEERVFRAKQ